MPSEEPNGRSETLRIYLLGEFRVELGSRTVAESSWRLRKARSLVKILALTSERRLHREQMIELLWPGADGAAGLRGLNQALHAARRALLSVYGSSMDTNDVIRHHRQVLSLLPLGPLWIDAEAFESKALEASRTGDGRLFDEAVDLYRDDLLTEDRYEDWVADRRIALNGVYLSLLHEFANRFEARGELPRAMDALRKIIAADPANEDAHAALMKLYALTGRRQYAIHQYHLLREILMREFQLDPDPSTVELHQYIVEGRFSVTDAAVALEEPGVPPERDPENDPGFFGRDADLDVLKNAVEDGLAGHGRVVMLSGEPGIGKTTLAETMTRLVTGGRRTSVYWGRCYQDEGAPAYWPWVQIIRSYLAGHTNHEIRERLGRHAADIAQIVPEVRERLCDVTEMPGISGSGARFRLFDAVSNVLKRIAAREPLLLVLDDLHWADRSSLLLLDFLVRDLRTASIVILATYRESDVDRFHPLNQALSQIVRQSGNRRIQLEGLSREDVGRFIAALAGLEPPDELVTAVYGLTEGNPFFVGEVVQLLIHEGQLSAPVAGHAWPLAIPASVREVIHQRLDRLSDEANALLAVGAVIGRDFGMNVLHLATGISQAGLLDILEEAVRARIVTETPDEPGRYRFSHALIRETIYGELGSARRTQLHGDIAEALETIFEDNLEPHLAELAHHYFRSAPRKDIIKAVDYSTRAGKWAMAQSGFDEAAGHYERALHALDLTTPVDYPRRCNLLLALGEAQRSAGDSAKSRETCLQAAMLARRLHLPQELAQAAATVAWASMEIRPWDQQVVRLLEEALLSLGPADGLYRVQVLGALVRALDYSGDVERRAALGNEAVAIARGLNDPVTLVHALESRLKSAIRPDVLDETIADAEEIIRQAEIVGDSYMTILGHWWRIDGLLGKGDMAAVDKSIAIGSQLSRERGEPRRIWEALCYQTMRALLTGRYEEAERLATEALEVGRRPAPRPSWSTYVEHMFIIRREQGRLAELDTDLRERVGVYRDYPFFHALLVVLLADTGRLDAARVEFDRLAAHDFTDVPRDVMWLVTIALLAEMANKLDDTPRARTLYDLLRPYPERAIMPDPIEFCLGSSSHFIGLLATTLDLHEEARHAFESAIAMNARMGAHPYVAHSSYEYARLCLRSDDLQSHDRALGLVSTALDIAHDLRMSRLARRSITLRAEIQRALSA